jgi:hypothetical protein
MHFSGNTMSRTVAFGRDVLSAPDVDIEVHYVEWKLIITKKMRRLFRGFFLLSANSLF